MPAQESTIFQTDPAYLRHKLEAGETPTFVMTVDENLKVYIDFNIYEGAIAGRAWSVYKTGEEVWTTEEPATLLLDGFIESDGVE